MLLAIDVGNTNVVLGAFGDSVEPQATWRLATDVRKTSDEWRLQISQLLAEHGTSLTDVVGVIISSVVPSVTAALGNAVPHEAVVVSSALDTGLDIRIDNPAELGADRIANAIGASALVSGPAIVVDMGTATTLDVLGANGEYLGGVIMPGLELAYEALFARTAALRRIEFVPPKSVIGTGTISALQSGATYGYASQIDGLCSRIETELGSCSIMATGGLSGVIVPLSSRIQRHVPWLTLQGLKLIYTRANA